MFIITKNTKKTGGMRFYLDRKKRDYSTQKTHTYANILYKHNAYSPYIEF